MVAPLIGAGVSLLGGLFGSRSARRAAQRAEQQAAARAAATQQYGREALGRVQGLEGFLPSYQAPSAGTFRPVNITSGYGRTAFNPQTGEIEQVLSDPMQRQQQFAYGAAQSLADQLGGFDPQEFARRRFEGYQGLLEPERQAQTSQLLSQLKRKGLLGWSQTPVGGTSTEAVNPLAQAFEAARARQDQELAMRAMTEGATEQERLARLQSTLFGEGARINDPLMRQMEASQRMGEAAFSREMGAAEMANRLAGQGFADRARLLQMSEPFAAMAATGGMQDQAAANAMMNQARLGQSQGFAQGLQRMGGLFDGMMPTPNFPGVGMFGSYFGTSPSPMLSAEVSRLGGSTMNPFSGYWTGRGGWGSYGE